MATMATVTCEECGHVVVRPSRGPRIVRFCSRACNIAFKVKARQFVNCLACGAMFRTFASKQSIGGGKFCSVRCGAASRRTETAPYVGGGITRREHIRVAERALGRRLPSGAQVHHVNDNGRDNRNANLVICQDAAYHKLLHVRRKVLRAGGDPNTQRFCRACGQLRDITIADCRTCARVYRERRERRKASAA